jgi:hypothetical protein
MTFRKLAADSAGKLIRAYFTENTPRIRARLPDRAVHRLGTLTPVIVGGWCSRSAETKGEAL